MLGKVSKLSPVPSLAKPRGSKGFPPTSSKPVALRAEAGDCAGFCTNAEDDAAIVARRAAVNLVIVALLIYKGGFQQVSPIVSSEGEGFQVLKVILHQTSRELGSLYRKESKDLLQL